MIFFDEKNRPFTIKSQVIISEMGLKDGDCPPETELLHIDWLQNIIDQTDQEMVHIHAAYISRRRRKFFPRGH